MPTLCWEVGWFSGSRLNQRVYTILEYNPAISTMAATTMAVQCKKKAFPSHSWDLPTQALFFTFKAMILGMQNIDGKIQEPGMITWDKKNKYKAEYCFILLTHQSIF